MQEITPARLLNIFTEIGKYRNKTAVKRFINVAVFIGICRSQLNIIKFKVKIILFIFSNLFKSRQDCFGIS